MAFKVNEIDLGLLVENMPDLILYLDMNKRLLSFNPGGKKFLKMIGCSNPTPGDDVLSFLPDEKQNFFLRQIDNLKKGEVFSFEDCYHAFQGIQYFDISIYALSGANGEQNGFCILLRDITDKRQVEEKYRRLFFDNPMVMYVIRLDNLRVLEVNDAAVRQYGYSRDEFLRRTALDLRLQEDHQKLKDYLSNLQKEGVDGPAGIWRHVLKNGQHIFMAICLHRIRFNNEDAVMAIGQNVTEKLELEQKLEEEKNLRNQELTEAIISAQESERAEIGRELHDNVNQLLVAARLHLSVEKHVPASQRKELIEKAAGYILSAIEEIRKLSKSLISPLQEEQTLETAISNLSNDLIFAHDFEITLDFNSFESIKLKEKFKLNIFRIIQEQLNNIIKHSNARNVIIALSSKNSEITIRIADDGVGFDSTAPRRGIGLTNIESRAKLYNGTLEIISSPGHGCCLVIQFPRNESTG